MTRVDGWLRPREPACFKKLMTGLQLGIPLGIVAGTFTGGAVCLRMGFRGHTMNMNMLKYAIGGAAWGGGIFALCQATRC